MMLFGTGKNDTASKELQNDLCVSSGFGLIQFNLQSYLVLIISSVWLHFSHLHDISLNI